MSRGGLLCLLLSWWCCSSLLAGCRAAPRKLVLVPTPATVLTYHHGPLLTSPTLNLYFLWYGAFSPAQKAVLTDFAASFSPSASPSSPSVASWWATAASYTDASGSHVSSSVTLAAQASVPAASPAKELKKSDIEALLVASVGSKKLPSDPKGVYFVLTADDVAVEDFCMNSCGYHATVAAASGARLTYAWVGNPGKQCPGYCAWPYAKAQFGPATSPLVSPNGDVGMEGMVINAAVVLAGAATNPSGQGYYQGDAGAPLEAASACAGIFGTGAYPGNPGALFTDDKSKASYNAHGADGRLFLLPALWKPSTQTCTPLS